MSSYLRKGTCPDNYTCYKLQMQALEIWSGRDVILRPSLGMKQAGPKSVCAEKDIGASSALFRGDTVS